MDDSMKIFIPCPINAWLMADVKQYGSDYVIVDVNDPINESSTKFGNTPAKKSDLTRKIFYNELPAGFDSFPLQNGKDVIVNDLTMLNHLHEPAILENLRRRFELNFPYTNTGNVCISMNPYKWLNIYSRAIRDTYSENPSNALPSHIYQVSANAVRNFILNASDQSILISGESGAGKTEAAKLLMNHIAGINLGDVDEIDGNSSTVQKILNLNPLLESFGNAKTATNDNSSRFGKFVQLQFSIDDIKLVGAYCNTYLLEKSRVVGTTEATERNFHIFYQIFGCPDEIKKEIHLSGKSPCDFKILCSGDLVTNDIEGVHDHLRYINTTNIMTTYLGLNASEVVNLLETVAGLLHLGNHQFHSNLDGVHSSIECNDEVANICAKLFGVEVKSLNRLLTMRSISVESTDISMDLTNDQCHSMKEALAKDIYRRIFGCLVYKINACTIAKRNTMRLGHISLLDIFGFESLEANHFEQLCINYANEKLQQKFTYDMVKTVQMEYLSEELRWETITFEDNVEVLNLIGGKAGLFALLNDECKVPMGSDTSLLSKAKSKFKNHPGFIGQFQTKKVGDFGIKHYAGDVMYFIDKFVQKNRDKCPDNISLVMKQSKNPLVASLYHDEGSHSVHEKTGKSHVETVVQSFTNQLNELMDRIGQSSVHYVRCIKPNPLKSQSIFSRKLVLNQLKCGGIIDAVRISRATYPTTLTHQQYLERFRCLKFLDSTMDHLMKEEVSSSPSRSSERIQCLELTEWIMNHVKNPSVVAGNLVKISNCSVDKLRQQLSSHHALIEVGVTKVYFSEGVIEWCNDCKYLIESGKVRLVQRIYRGWAIRKAYLEIRHGIIIIQRNMRRWWKKVQWKKDRDEELDGMNFAAMLIQKRVKLFLRRKAFNRAKNLKVVHSNPVDHVPILTVSNTVSNGNADPDVLTRGEIQRKPRLKAPPLKWRSHNSDVNGSTTTTPTSTTRTPTSHTTTAIVERYNVCFLFETHQEMIDHIVFFAIGLITILSYQIL